MYFDTNRFSTGLLNALKPEIDLYSVKSFSLDITEGPIVEYLNTMGLNFIKTFHIGCSQDNRQPSFSFSDCSFDESFSLFYERRLIKAPNIYPKDKRGERDIKILASEFSNPEYCWETISITKRINEGNLVHNARISLNLENNKIWYFDGYNLGLIVQSDLPKFWRKIESLDDAIIKNISAQSLVAEFLRLYNNRLGDITKLEPLSYK